MLHRKNTALLPGLLMTALAWAEVAVGQSEKPPQGALPPDGLKALQHADAQVRYRAAETLARLGPTARFAVPELREALKDKNGLVRLKVAEALWRIEPTPRLLLPVLLAALRDKDADVRGAAPAVIALLGDKAKPALPALIDALGDEELSVKMEATAALGDLGPIALASASALLDLTADKDGALLQPLIAASLSNLGPDVVPILEQALKAKAAERRSAAAYALGSIGPLAAPATAALADRIRDLDPTVRAFALRALGSIGKEARAALPAVQAALDDETPAVQVQAALALYRIDGQARHVHILVKTLAGEPAVREAACQALAAIGPAAKDAVPELRKTLHDEEPSVRGLALEALGRIGPAAEKALPEMRGLYKDDDREVGLRAAFAAWQIGGDAGEALGVLKQGLGDEKSAPKKRALQLLGEMKQSARPILGDLVGRYRDEVNPSLRAAFVAAIRQIDATVAEKLGIQRSEER